MANSRRTTTTRKTRSQKIGDRGENRVTDCLKSFLPESQVLHDIILTNGDSTSQIDNIAVTCGGIFVIEVKNYCADLIFCDINAPYWYYILPAAHNQTQKETFYNPIWQNNTHSALISNLFHNTIPVYNVVVFAKDNPLKFTNGERPDGVVSIFKLKEFILKKNSNISTDIINRIVQIIQDSNRTDVSLAEHIDNISRYKS